MVIRNYQKIPSFITYIIFSIIPIPNSIATTEHHNYKREHNDEVVDVFVSLRGVAQLQVEDTGQSE